MDTSRRQDLTLYERDFVLPQHDPERLQPLVDATLTILSGTGVRCDAPAPPTMRLALASSVAGVSLRPSAALLMRVMNDQSSRSR